MTVPSSTLAPPERQSPTGIDILIVGAGLGGLFAAVELYRQGHTVRIIESKVEVEGLGTPFHKIT